MQIKKNLHFDHAETFIDILVPSGSVISISSAPLISVPSVSPVSIPSVSPFSVPSVSTIPAELEPPIHDHPSVSPTSVIVDINKESFMYI